MAYARVSLVSDLLEFLAGWDLSDGMIDTIDTIDTVEVDRHLSAVAERRLTGVLLAAMQAGEVEVDRSEVVVEAHERALARARLLDTAMLQSVEILLDAGITPFLLMGSAIARLLPEPDQRISADIDLLVPADRLDAAASALEAFGASRSQPAISPDWERRFAPSVTIGWRTGTELNMHRTLAPGPYGHLVDLDELAASTVTVDVGGVDVLTLRPELHLVHAALHVALGGVEPRLGDVRDIALLLERINLDVDRVMRTDYVISDLQPTYFVIESFEDLYRQTVERDFDRLYRNLGAGFTYANSAVIDVDNVLHRGTQEYFLRGGRGSSAKPV